MLKHTYKIIKSLLISIRDAIDHDGIEHAGYISFLLMLSIFPFLIFLMSATTLIGEKPIADLLIHLILESSWAGFIDALKPRIVEITSAPPQGLLTIAILSAIWTASSIFEGLRTILNRSFRVTSPPSYIFRRLLSFFEFLVTIFILIIFVSFLTVTPGFIKTIIKALQVTSTFAIEFTAPQYEYLRVTILYLFTFFSIAYAYYALPSRKHKFKYMLPGAVLVMASWITFSRIFSYYLNYFPQVNLIYGSIAGIIIALLYFYFCSLIFIIGAEFNYHLETSIFKRKK